MMSRAERIEDLEHLWYAWVRKARYVEYVQPGPEWLNTGARWLTDEQVEAEHGETEVWVTLADGAGVMLVKHIQTKRLETPPKPEPTPEQDERTSEIIKAYKAGAGMFPIGERYGMTWRAVQKILIAAGIPIRGRGEYDRFRAHREAGD